MNQTPNTFNKKVIMFTGHVCVGLGFVGFIVPLMPGTVFFISAAYCYAKSSDKFYFWITEHKIFGIHIKNYEQGKISLRGKIISVSSMSIAILISIFLISPPLWVTLLLIATNLAVAFYIIRLKTA